VAARLSELHVHVFVRNFFFGKLATMIGPESPDNRISHLSIKVLPLLYLDVCPLVSSEETLIYW